MARGKSYGRRGRGNYKFTYKRKAALARAQAISARKRKGDSPIKKIGKVAGVAIAVGATAYLGHRHRGTISATASNWKRSVQPGQKEAVRIGSAISNAAPSRTTVIGPGERAAAQSTREALNKLSLPPQMGGPDRRIYNEDDSVNSEAMTNRGVRQTVRKSKARVSGNKTSSLTGTPGGTKTPPQATKRRDPMHGGFTDDQWQDILGFEEAPKSPVSQGTPGVAGRAFKASQSPFGSDASSRRYAAALDEAHKNAARLRNQGKA